MNLHGFTITDKKNIGDAEFTEMRHDKTGAKLAWLGNKDENKLFSISFRTVPEDDTGVFHILEHSVLGGSENYPVKEPFLYLLKSSMNTFLNAMTFPDKTMFPVSSRNNADFMNLTKVYLDAVFKPSIYTNPCIFYQEGHHIEYRSDGDTPAYKGVVFNEMKGVVSAVDERIESKLMQMLFPESCYRFEYGGLPQAIPNLTYQQFIDTHKRFYHPTNSYIWLDGDIDIEATLELIDSYLSEYDKSEWLPEIPVQVPVDFAEETEYYEISPEESAEENAHLAIGKILASWNDCEKVYAYLILCTALAGSNDSPLKRALLDTGLCLDVEMSLSDGISQPFGMLKIDNIDSANSSKILSTVKDIVKNIVSNGIGNDILLSAINRAEFIFRESEEPQGLTRCIDAMSSWLYGGEPLLYVNCGDVFDKLRAKAVNGYFEELLAEWLLDDSGTSVLYMLPSHTYGKELKEAEQKQLEKAVAEADKSELIELNRKLDEWQKAPDKAEDIAKIPILSLDEISENPIDYKTSESDEDGVKILHHPAKNKGISCINLWFDVSDVNRHELEILLLINQFISELPTEKSTGAELNQRITGILGNFATDICSFSRPESPEKCKTYFCIKSRFLSSDTNQALELISEIITQTVYDNSELLNEIISQNKEELRQDIIADGHRFAMRRARCSLSAESAVNEIVNGFESYRFIRELDEEKIKSATDEMKALSKRIFCKLRLTAGITSSEKISLSPVISALPDGDTVDFTEMELSVLNMGRPSNQGIIIPSGVSYSGAVLAENNQDKALWDLLSTIMTYEYLWNEVRVKGGAYGTGTGTNALGETAFYSFRDPSPDNSIEIYSESAEFIKSYCAEKPDITHYIISTIARGEPLISDAEYGTTADIFHFRGIDFAERKQVRKRILSMKYTDLLDAVPSLENMSNYCIIGAKEVMKDTDNIFEL
ncbi:MAG: insulinase family protein [Ruminococcus sp.]|nr:insulinase family protein [Ruminococcus sp.]